MVIKIIVAVVVGGGRGNWASACTVAHSPYARRGRSGCGIESRRRFHCHPGGWHAAWANAFGYRGLPRRYALNYLDTVFAGLMGVFQVLP